VPGWFLRFFLNDFGPAPAPDVGRLPTFEQQQIVEVMYSESQVRRAIVTKDAKNFYRVYVQHWDTSDWGRGHGAFWTGAKNVGSLTDRIDVAREFAQLAAASGD
jgi:hypothetical protein